MGNVQAVIDLPEKLYHSLSASGLTKERMADDSRKLLALKYFKEKVLSLSRAAELSGLSKWDFIEYLGDNDVPVINYGQDEMKRELETSDQSARSRWVTDLSRFLPVPTGCCVSLQPQFGWPGHKLLALEAIPR